MMLKSKRRLQESLSGGFTLIELLVVIAIIAILATILLPTLGRARKLARKTACMSHVNALNNALHLYSADNDGFLCRTYHPADPENGWWVMLMSEYYLDGVDLYNSSLGYGDLVGNSVLFCPEFDPIEGTNGGSIGYNQGLDAWSPSLATAMPMMRMSDISKPGKTVAFGDSRWDTYSKLWGGSFTYRHDFGCNFGLIDGHVEWAQTTAEDPIFPWHPDKFIYDPIAGE